MVKPKCYPCIYMNKMIDKINKMTDKINSTYMPYKHYKNSIAILFLASDESSYMTGTIVPVGGDDQG